MASEWARLNVTGPGAAAPSDVRCAPNGVSSVEIKGRPVAADVMVYYTIHTTPTGKFYFKIKKTIIKLIAISHICRRNLV